MSSDDDFDAEWQAMMRGDFDEFDDGSDDHETYDGEDDFTDAELAWLALDNPLFRLRKDGRQRPPSASYI